jgi:hypothetical protein
MDKDSIEKSTEERAKRRTKKRRPQVKMSGKRTREIPRLWKEKKGH